MLSFYIIHAGLADSLVKYSHIEVRNVKREQYAWIPYA